MTLSLRSAPLPCFLALSAIFAGAAAAHQGPDPVAHWIFSGRSVEGDSLKARLGPPGKLIGGHRVVADELGDSILFDGRDSGCIVAGDLSIVRDSLPDRDLTVAAWVSVDEPKPWGSVVGTIQDNGDAEKGWLLGYDEKVFVFALASKGADDGDGKMTYLKGNTPYVPGMLFHVAAVYDGAEMQLYVNGKLDASSKDQSGDILYPEQAPFTIGLYKDRDESYSHKGRIREATIYDLAAKEAWVTHDFEHAKRLAELPPVDASGGARFVVAPYLQYGTMTGMTVMWQSSVAGSSKVRWGETSACENEVAVEGQPHIHEVRIEGLKAGTQYFYRTITETPGGLLESEVFTFVTAVDAETPFAFVVIGDTQGNPAVSGKLAKLAWAQRPSFLLHAGDLVDAGTNDGQWTGQFFPSMHELISRVPFYPTLGNHEQNARNYFDYMSLPTPEYYYDFRFGNAHFFMIDTNRNVGPDSEQYRWLDEAMGNSDATWKFVCHHHPAYSSDENDYGDLWKTNRSTRGDERVRQLVPLYEKHGVDVVWSGHIHSYERTWPVRESRAVEQNGTIYVVTGGGGGSLETPGPIRPYFQNNVRHGFHHYAMVAINGGTLEFKAFDLDDRLFDTLKIEKKSKVVPHSESETATGN